MKKIKVVLLSGFAIVALASFTVSSSKEDISIKIENPSMSGTHCSGTVGCGCSGFAPITNGEVWQQAYCKHCGHHRRCHK